MGEKKFNGDPNLVFLINSVFYLFVDTMEGRSEIPRIVVTFLEVFLRVVILTKIMVIGSKFFMDFFSFFSVFMGYK